MGDRDRNHYDIHMGGTTVTNIGSHGNTSDSGTGGGSNKIGYNTKMINTIGIGDDDEVYEYGYKLEEDVNDDNNNEEVDDNYEEDDDYYEEDDVRDTRNSYHMINITTNNAASTAYILSKASIANNNTSH
jgi:hypothetical protein